MEGKKQEARALYAETVAAFVLGRDAPYADKLLFDIPSEDTTNPDESVVASDLLDQVKEKAKALLGVGSRMVADVWLA